MNIEDRNRYWKWVGQNLRDARREAELTQKELAEALSVDSSTVCGWETGRRGVPVEMLSRLRTLLNTSYADLLGANQIWR